MNRRTFLKSISALVAAAPLLGTKLLEFVPVVRKRPALSFDEIDAITKEYWAKPMQDIYFQESPLFAHFDKSFEPDHVYFLHMCPMMEHC